MVAEPGFEPRLSPESKLLTTLHVFLTPITSSFTKDLSLAALLPSTFKALCNSAPAHFCSSISTPCHSCSLQAVLLPLPRMPFSFPESGEGPAHMPPRPECSLTCSPAAPLACSPEGCLSLQGLPHLPRPVEHPIQCAGVSCQGPHQTGGSPQAGWAAYSFSYLLHSFIHSTNICKHLL